ncbi:MAG: hypothetical protein K2H64_11340 [Desulfovibrio sp.]|nr:hypothetical protein [Desulfovibrio sp.]
MESGENRELLLIGGGEFCATVIEALAPGPWRAAGVVVSDRRIKEVAGVPVVGSESSLNLLRKTFSQALITLGYRAGPRLRNYFYNLLTTCEYQAPAVATPLANKAPAAEIGPGTLIMPYARAAERARLGECCLIGDNCEIGAGARVGAFCVIEPGAIISENAIVGDGCRVGARAVIGAGIVLGKRCSIADGSAVFKDVPPYKIFRQ